MKIVRIVKFGEEIKDKNNKVIIKVDGEFDKSTGRVNIYTNPLVNTEEIEKNETNVKTQMEQFKKDLQQLMKDEKFSYCL